MAGVGTAGGSGRAGGGSAKGRLSSRLGRRHHCCMSLAADLGRLIGPEHVLDDGAAAAQYERDASNRAELKGRADAVVLPGSAEEVAAIVRWCYENDIPIVPRGGGTGLTGGAVPTEGGVVCSLERLRRIRVLQPELWRLEAEAGVTTAHVHRLARENGLMFAPDPGASEQSQIGGNIATNAGGPHALKHGVTGAWVAGLEAVIAPGEIVRLGGWQRKDVAGYDLLSLMIGSEGTLGVITSARLRLLPAPETALTLVAFAPTRARACTALLEIPAAGIQAAALDFADAATFEIVAAGYPGQAPPGARFALLIELDGAHAQVQADLRTLRELLEDDRGITLQMPADARALWRWRDGFNGVVSKARGAKVSEDVSFPVERLCEGLERFAAIAAEHGLPSCAWGHGGEGNVHATVLVDPSDPAELSAAHAVGEELFALAIELGGSIAAEHGVGWLKRGRLRDQWDPRAVELHDQIKRSFDPKGLLNPGKKLASGRR
jgi:glycolate oxidase subunit GlcD